jgi:hypothetical protein
MNADDSRMEELDASLPLTLAMIRKALGPWAANGGSFSALVRDRPEIVAARLTAGDGRTAFWRNHLATLAAVVPQNPGED